MHKVLLIGNPNVGKSTLFNSLTKSKEHTGNFHGVTVDKKSKVVSFNNQDYEFIDLPGLYSLNTLTQEEDVSKNYLLNNAGIRLVIADANTLKRNLYLCLQLKEMGLDFKLLINNYDYFIKKKNNLNLNILKNYFDVEIINAKKEKLSKKLININKFDAILPYLQHFFDIIQKKFNYLNNNQILNALNGIFNNLNEEVIEFINSLLPQIIEARYKFIEHILSKAITNSGNVYGWHKVDKFLLNPAVMMIGFFAFFFASIYVIFFWLGAYLSNILIYFNEQIIVQNFMNIIYAITDNIWIIEFFSNGVFSSISTVLTFLPQVALLFVFLTLLEDGGIISRMCYVFDDFLSAFGLNGKAIYIMLMGLGCNTMSTYATRNMNGKNTKLKTALINPYISCMARLPVFVIIASTFFGKYAYFVVAGLYLLGVVVALALSFILNKTILKTTSSELLLEFPPLRGIDFKHTLSTGIENAKDMFKRIFSVVLSVGVIVWCLTHTKFNFNYTQNFSESILYFFADKLAILFKPIGLGSAGIVGALIAGIMAKELIVSTMSVTNNVQTTPALMKSLILPTSVICFNMPSAVSFLIFVLLYCPCVSNIAVLKAEVGGFWAVFSVVSQLTIAYSASFVAYTAITKGVAFALVLAVIIAIIMFAMVFVSKKIKQHKCLSCGKCKNKY